LNKHPNKYKTVKIVNWTSKKFFISNPSKIEVELQEARIRNNRQAVFQLVRDLRQAQLDRSYEELVKRLWQDVADRDFHLDRVINLMHTCSFHEDGYEMTKVDETYKKTGLFGELITLH